jgi:WD40 repeat protein/tRNA A-37 threonylcarbamoyl transferase component Bud32
MAVMQKCSVCGAAIPVDKPKWGCPVCLLENALSGSATETDDHSTKTEAAPELDFQRSGPASRRFGEYELLEEIGRGGMGVVYKARQVSLDRVVAVKMLMFGPLASATAVKRFRTEAVAAASLQHANVVAIHEVGMHADQHYLVMDYVEGTTLDNLVGNKPLAPRRAAGYLQTIAKTIHFAHEHGILHRDLKPSNILIDQNDQPRVTDFGLAKRLDDSAFSTLHSSLTVTGQIVGSPGYMAPEQAAPKNRQTSRATDVYALGAVLYHAITGRPPFAGENLADALHQALHNEPVPPHLLNASVPRDLETICLRCLEKEPQKRYPTAQALVDELGRFLDNKPILARPVGRLERARRWCQRRPAIASLAGAALLLLLVVLIGSPLALARIAAQRSLAEERLYVADMNLAHEAWQGGDLQRAQTLLRRHLPQPHRDDLRAFEWRYLWKLCQDESRRTFTNFVGPVRSLAFSPDDRLLAAGGGHQVKLLNLATGREISEWSDPDCDIRAIAFSPTKPEILATAGEGGDLAVKLWNLTTREVIARLPGHSSGIEAIAFSPDGKLLASSANKTLKVWQLQLQTNLWTQPTSVPVGAVLFTSDGKMLISGGGKSGNALVWDASTGTELAPFPALHTGWIQGLALDPNGRTLATCSEDSQVILWDLKGRRHLATLTGHGGPVSAVAFSLDGGLLASAGGDNTVRVWDVASGRPRAMLRGHLGAVNCLVFTPDGTSVVSGGDDHSVRMWDWNQPRQDRILPGKQSWLAFLALSPDGGFLAVADYHQHCARLWDVPRRQFITNFFGHTAPVWCAAFSPNGRLLASGSEDRTVRVWDLANLAPLGCLTNRFEAGAIAFSPDGKLLATAGLTFNPIVETNRLAFWDLASQKELLLPPAAKGMASAIAFAGNGRLFATGHFDGQVRLWDLAHEKFLAQFQAHNGLVFSLAFSKDSALLASSGKVDGNVVLYDVAARRPFKPLRGHSSDVWSVAFDPDGKTLASAGYDGTIKLWNLATREPALTLKQSFGPVASVAFSPAGGLLASCGADGDVWLWPAASAAEVP